MFILQRAKMSFRCDTCPRTFTCRSTLNRHKRESCLQVKPKRIYPCAYCQKRFTRRHSAKRHWNICSLRTLEKFLEKSHSL